MKKVFAPGCALMVYKPELGRRLLDFLNKDLSNKVLRYWTYDLKKLYAENTYLLYPLQIFKLRKRMNEVSSSNKSEEVKKSEMFKIYIEIEGEH